MSALFGRTRQGYKHDVPLGIPIRQWLFRVDGVVAEVITAKPMVKPNNSTSQVRLPWPLCFVLTNTYTTIDGVGFMLRLGLFASS